jgi:hypothetical protein
LLAALIGPKVSANNGGGVIVSRSLRSRAGLLCDSKEKIEEKMVAKSVLTPVLWTVGTELASETPFGVIATILNRKYNVCIKKSLGGFTNLL